MIRLSRRHDVGAIGGRRLRALGLALAAGLSGATIAPVLGQTVSTESLLREMTDLAGLAEFPDPPFTCRQFSSYDRASRSPDDPIGWFANNDTGNYLRVEEIAAVADTGPGDPALENPPPRAAASQRTEYVMMDAAGPGAIVRMWSANPAGTLRIYLDNQPTPVIECPMADWLGGKYPGVPTPIAGERSKGWNSYFPIPYAKHCKVTSDAGGFYYHVNYRTYPAGTPVETFQASQLRSLSEQVSQVAGRLASPTTSFLSLDTTKFAVPFKAALAPGNEHAIVFTGPAQLRRLIARVEAGDVRTALRRTVLTIEFDGETTVVCPLGDFFGTANGLSAFASLPIIVDKDGGMASFWVMPFERSARITFKNLGRETVVVSGDTFESRRGTPWTRNSMHFHATWRQQMQVPTRPMIDWNYLTATGRGVFAGASFHIANPVRAWWGEGDEKIYVDGEAFPSHFGTGSEDYFGYAWCSPGLFTHAYHNQPRCDGPGNYGHTTVNRFHILDRIPFHTHFQFDMELWHWHETCRVDMSVVAYWYARPGGTDTSPPIKPENLVLPELPPYKPERVAGAIEGESLRILEKVGAVAPQSIAGCSSDEHLWWHREQKPGDRLVLAFPVAAAGPYRVTMRCLMARDYGIHQIWINGRKAGEPIDFYNEGIRVSPEHDLGIHELVAGENRLTIEVIGANEKAVKAYMFGLDYLRLEPAP